LYGDLISCYIAMHKSKKFLLNLEKKILNLFKANNLRIDWYLYSQLSDIYYHIGNSKKCASYLLKAFNSGRENIMGLTHLGGYSDFLLRISQLEEWKIGKRMIHYDTIKKFLLDYENLNYDRCDDRFRQIIPYEVAGMLTFITEIMFYNNALRKDMARMAYDQLMKIKNISSGWWQYYYALAILLTILKDKTNASKYIVKAEDIIRNLKYDKEYDYQIYFKKYFNFNKRVYLKKIKRLKAILSNI